MTDLFSLVSDASLAALGDTLADLIHDAVEGIE